MGEPRAQSDSPRVTSTTFNANVSNSPQDLLPFLSCFFFLLTLLLKRLNVVEVIVQLWGEIIHLHFKQLSTFIESRLIF